LRSCPAAGQAGATELEGGYELVASGGIVSGATISAGTLEVASGAIASPSEAAFVGGGTLLLDASASFHGLVAGFGSSDQLDLQDVAFVTATTKKGQQSNLSFTDAASNQSGTLTVTDGTHTAASSCSANTRRSSSPRQATDTAAPSSVSRRHPPARPVCRPVGAAA